MKIDASRRSVAGSKISRRRLVQGAGVAAGLTVFWSSGLHAAQSGTDASPVASPMAGATPESTPVATAPVAPTNLDAYLRVNEDGTVTLLTGKVEYGQGIETGFRQLAAEELYLPFESVTAVMGQTDKTPWDIVTAGSLSTRLTGPRVRQAGTAMRAWLLELGAEKLGQDVSKLSLKDGSVVVTADTSKAVTFAELAKGKKDTRELDPNLKLKDPATFSVVGQSVPRPDVAHKVNGEMKYGIDAVVEGMVWGKIVRPNGFGSTLTDIDFSEAEKMPGFVGSFRDGDFAGIAAERREQVEAAITKVKATWKPSPSTTTSDTIFDVLIKTSDKGEVIGDDTGPAQKEGNVTTVTEPLELTFRAPFVVHTPIEPRSALVEIKDDQVNVWSSTQDPWTVQSVVAAIVERDPKTVVVTPLAAGGAFGSKINPMAEPEAAKLAKAFKRPVKIVWSRAEEFTAGQYRPAMLVNITTGIDGQGGVASWLYDLHSASYFPEGSKTQNGAAADWSADIKEIYDVAVRRTTWFQANSPLPPFYWRVNGASTNTWAREVTLDILAEQSGVDPVTFRRNLLKSNARMEAVMDAVVKKSGWKPGVGMTGQGIGIALGFDATTFVAEVAQVEVDQKTGEIMVKHVDVAIDCGLIVNPGAVTHQVEGSVVMGVSSALREFITFEHGIVTNASFAQYAPITMRETPTIDVVFVEDKTNPMGGVGEPAVSPVTGAVANAVYDLLGIRLYDTPFTADRVLAEIKKKGAATPTASPAASPAATPAASPAS